MLLVDSVKAPCYDSFAAVIINSIRAICVTTASKSNSTLEIHATTAAVCSMVNESVTGRELTNLPSLVDMLLRAANGVLLPDQNVCIKACVDIVCMVVVV